MKTATIRAKSGDVVEILVYDQIGRDWFGDGIEAKGFREQIKDVKAKTINLRINSPGGSVIEGAAMLTALDEFKGRIEVDVDGLSASAASVLMMAGDEIRVASNGLVMIHNPMAGVMGGAEDMDRMADLLRKVKGQILDSYERHSKAGRDQLSDWMDAETWFTGKEAVDAGLAHSVSDAVNVAAFAGFKDVAAKMKFKNAPASLTAKAVEEAAWMESKKRKEIAAKLLEIKP